MKPVMWVAVLGAVLLGGCSTIKLGPGPDATTRAKPVATRPTVELLRTGNGALVPRLDQEPLVLERAALGNAESAKVTWTLVAGTSKVVFAPKCALTVKGHSALDSTDQRRKPGAVVPASQSGLPRCDGGGGPGGPAGFADCETAADGLSLTCSFKLTQPAVFRYNLRVLVDGEAVDLDPTGMIL